MIELHINKNNEKMKQIQIEKNQRELRQTNVKNYQNSIKKEVTKNPRRSNNPVSNSSSLLEEKQEQQNESNVNLDDLENKLASVNLIRKPTMVQLLNKAAKITNLPGLKIDENKLDLNKSLVDQILNIQSIESTLTSPTKTNDLKCEKVKVEKFSCAKPASSSICVAEALSQIGAQFVPVDSFPHVNFYHHKEEKQFNATNNQTNNSFLRKKKVSGCLKLEYVHGGRFYWDVKMKRVSGELFLVKLVRSVDDEPVKNAPTSPASSISSTASSLNDSLISDLNNNHCDLFFFSIDLSSKLSKLWLENLRPVGWSKKHRFQPKKPTCLPLNEKTIECKCCQNFDLSEYLKERFLNSSFQESCLCEFKENDLVNVARVLCNKHGRLLIEYSNEADETKRVWLFANDPRLNGHAKLDYQKSDLFNRLSLSEESGEKKNEPRQKAHLKKNNFVECLHENKFYAAKVIEVKLDYVKLELDSKERKILTVYSNSFHCLFPCKWCMMNNLKLEAPKCWDESSLFDWDLYVERLGTTDSDLSLVGEVGVLNWSRNLAQLADKFQLGMYLECALRRNYEVICLGRVKAKVGHLIFVEVVGKELDDDGLLVFTVDSTDLYPVGWCEMSNYYDDEISYMENYKIPNCDLEIDCEKVIRADAYKIPFFTYFQSKENWCPKIYLNTQCNIGPYFVESKLSRLPKSFGPGPIVLVLTKLVQMLISHSEKPGKLSQLFQGNRRNSTNNLPNKDELFLVKPKSTVLMRFKAKVKGKYIFKEIEVCYEIKQLNEYLNDLCNKLKCCTQMLSLNDLTNEATKPNFNQNICIQFKCCVFCSINYFSSSNSTINEFPLKNGHNKTQCQINNGHKKRPSNQNEQPHQHRNSYKIINNQMPKSNSNNNNDNTSCSGVFSNNKRPKIIYDKNYSPIRTRNMTNAARQCELDSEMRKLSKSNNSSDCEVIELIKTEPKLVNNEKNLRRQIISSGEKEERELSTEPRIKKVCNESNHLKKETHLTTNLNETKIDNGNENIGNPVFWTTSQVCTYLLDNKFDQGLVHMIQEQEIDGQSFLMLNLPTIQNYMNLKFGPAIKLAHLVEQLKQFQFLKFPPS